MKNIPDLFILDIMLPGEDGLSILKRLRAQENTKMSPSSKLQCMLKEMNVNDLNAQRYSYQMGVHYMDLINDCEKLGDYVVNVVEAHVNHKLTS